MNNIQREIAAIPDPAVREARASGYLADKNKRVAEISEAVGMTEHAQDARSRQRNMLAGLESAASAENARRRRS